MNYTNTGFTTETQVNPRIYFNKTVIVSWALARQPALNGVDPPPLAETSARHGIADPRQASNMIITVKRRFRSALREHVRITVITDEQVDKELAEILQFLPRGAQDSK